MEMMLDRGDGTKNLIRRADPGRLTINETVYTASLVLSPRSLLEAWPPAHIDSLEAAHIKPILALEPELVLLGTGNTLVFPDTAVLRELIAAGIGYEIMDTAAACRTYNILMSEGRGVVAGLIIEALNEP